VNRNVPIAIQGMKFVKVSAGRLHMLMLSTDGFLYSSGYNAV
jgi:alpha-tubulin suppressor-like RCC1 family protein